MHFTLTPAPQHRLPIYKTVLCVTIALILVVNGISLFQNLRSLKSANAQLMQSSRVAERLQYLDVLVQDAESSMRGYFLSGQDIYLGPPAAPSPRPKPASASWSACWSTIPTSSGT
jgi:hypothetical protein